MKWFNKLLCTLLGHERKPIIVFWDKTRKVRCNRCHGQWHANMLMTNLSPWDEHWAAVYKDGSQKDGSQEEEEIKWI